MARILSRAPERRDDGGSGERTIARQAKVLKPSAVAEADIEHRMRGGALVDGADHALDEAEPAPARDVDEEARIAHAPLALGGDVDDLERRGFIKIGLDAEGERVAEAEGVEPREGVGGVKALEPAERELRR